MIKAIDAQILEALHSARAVALAKTWDAGARPQELILDIDASLLTAHSEKESAAGTYKGGFGFFPLLCYLAETGEPLAGVLRPGNAGANTADDHFEVLQLALEQLRRQALGREILVRADIGGRTHAFTQDCRDAGVRFSVGYEVEATVREAIDALPDWAWQQAVDGDGTEREGAQVAEEILAVLLGWMDLELEVSVHGANGAQPAAALEARGQLRRGDESASPVSVVSSSPATTGASRRPSGSSKVPTGGLVRRGGGSPRSPKRRDPDPYCPDRRAGSALKTPRGRPPAPGDRRIAPNPLIGLTGRRLVAPPWQ